MHGEKYVEEFEKNQSKYRLKRIIDSIDLDSSYNVADYACGNGMMLPLISDMVKTYVGIDFSKDFIAAARKNMENLSIINARFECADILEFCDLHKGSFDVAFAMDFSEHVYDQQWLQILKAIKKSLKPGGRLYLHTPNAEFFLEKMKARNFIVKQLPEHIAVRNPKENCDLLEKSHYKVNKVVLLAHYNILRYLHPLSFIPLIGKWFKARIFIEATT